MAHRASSSIRRAALLAGPFAAALACCGGATAAAEPVAYGCDSGRQVLATYGVGADGGARLAFDGRSFDLHQVRSASGARYATEQGLSPDRGLQWWIKGETATLSEMLMDHTAPEPQVIDTCRALARP